MIIQMECARVFQFTFAFDNRDVRVRRVNATMGWSPKAL